MIRLVHLVIFLGLSLAGRPQDPGEPFYVVGLRGRIICKQSKRALNYGDKVYTRDTLEAQAKDYYLGLMNRYGMYELNPGGGKPAGDGWSEFALSVMSTIRQVEYKNPDVRGEIDQSIDIARSFHPGDTIAENRILMLDSDRVKIYIAAYPTGINNFFCWRPSGTSSNLIPIRAKRDTLLLQKRDFQDGSMTPGSGFDLYYQHEADGIVHRERITDFEIIFLPPAEASALIDHFLQASPDAAQSPEKDLESQLKALFTRSYQAAPRGILLDGLIKKKVKDHLKNKHS